MDKDFKKDDDVSLDNTGLPPPSDKTGGNSRVKKPQKNDAKHRKKKKEKEFRPSDLVHLQEKLDKKEIGFFKNLDSKRYTRKVSRGIIMERLISVALILMFLTISVVYFFSYTYVNSGYGINVIADQRITKAVSLTEDDNFERLTVGLKASAIVEMDNITYDWLPPDLDERGGGPHNGDNYIAYTFYVLNSGNQDLEYISKLRIKHSTQNVETAIRVKVFTDGVPVIYTHTYEPQIDALFEGYGIQVKEFYAVDERIIAYNIIPLAMEAYNRYTVVVWLEGFDNDCVNDKFSSELQMVWDIFVIEK
ncbi:MAG: hypothetical protein CVV59_01380 [Tenericutes bacterium HGW-Tenericutes-4]|jgi:hypothetical protein|nr:MAG: hypothetical protein CVV59_01380 [Tenericutes bacterium HGW-Tenericutes-4]